MSGESSKRSNLIDITNQHLYSLLCGRSGGTTPEQITEYLNPRIPQLKNVDAPFGAPSDAGRKKIESGSATLRDGVVLRVEPADKTFIFAISKHFEISEVAALVLLRSFMSNEGFPVSTGKGEESDIVNELLDAITPFYYSERLNLLRTLIPLFRADMNPEDPLSAVAADILPEVLDDGNSFADKLLKEYVNKAQAKLPPRAGTDPHLAAPWARQNAREQLVILEVLFWTMWNSAACDGPTVEHIYKTAYETALGMKQQNSTLLLDEESVQLLRDMASLWILVMLEVLELEHLADGKVDLVEEPNGEQKHYYWASPESLIRIHELVLSHTESHYVITFIAWAYVLLRLAHAAIQLQEKPKRYTEFFEIILPQPSRSYTKEREPIQLLMARTCLNPDAGLFNLLHSLLTSSPVFVTAAAWKTASSITDPNAVAYRSVVKGLLNAIVELCPVELIPDYDALVEVWIAYYGRSEVSSISAICQQFWESDYAEGHARRAILDVARTRFPVQFRPLTRLLRSLTATGFMGSDPSSATSHTNIADTPEEGRRVCGQHVYQYLSKLPTYTQVIPASACTGAHALYEKMPERSATSSTAGFIYISMRPVKLPGGSTLPAKSVGRLLSGDGSDLVVVAWQHEHSGWKLMLEFLTDYVNRRRRYSGNGSSYRDASFAPRGGQQVLSLQLADIGVENHEGDDEIVVIDILDLICSVVQDDAYLAERLLGDLEQGEAVVAHTLAGVDPPDLVELTMMILEEALSRSTVHGRVAPKTALITSAMGVLTALLALPNYSDRVWLYVRSSSSLFGSERSIGVTSSVLAAERLTGNYTMTLALLHLVQRLFEEASGTVVSVLQYRPSLQKIKEEVLLRAVRFVHSEIWVEHMNWKYAQMSDRLEIGKRISTFYTIVLQHSYPGLQNVPFAELSRAIADAFLSQATTSTITPLVSSVITAGAVLDMLFKTRRHSDARCLIYLTESHLGLIRLLLSYKADLMPSVEPCLLEQALCAKVGSSIASFDGGPSKVDPVDALAAYATDSKMGQNIPTEATRVLSALCSSLAATRGSLTIIGHLTDPEAIVMSLVRIVQHPYNKPLLRSAVWNFITLAVDKEPALARLFVTGQLRAPSPATSAKGKERAQDESSSGTTTAVTVACDMLQQWDELKDSNPQLLASVLRFLDTVWQHFYEHKEYLESIRTKSSLFEELASILGDELPPAPDYETTDYVDIDGVQRSNFHQAVSAYAYRTAVKSHAVHILALDIKIQSQSQGNSAPTEKPPSYTAIEGIFTSEDQLSDLIQEAAVSVYDPSLYDQLAEQVKHEFPTFVLEHLRVHDPVDEREYGDSYAFSTNLLHVRLQEFAYDPAMRAIDAHTKLTSVNLNLSLAQAQTRLTESWQYLLLQVVPYLRGNRLMRTTLLSLAATISDHLSAEKRSGEMMSAIHCARLSLLLALLEAAWFSASDEGEELRHFMTLVENVHGIILNTSQSPAQSLLGQVTVPFHRPLLQVVYFCARHSRSLARRGTMKSAQRLSIASLLDVTLLFVIDSLRITFDSASLGLDVELDQDMELLVAVFEHCTRLDLNTSATFWLTRCQETGVIRASLHLLSRMDIVGLADLSLLRARKHPLYTPHVLTFHMALACIPSSAERLASEGILAAYGENAISQAAKAGMIDTVLPELPGERSPAHSAYCSMLAILAGVITALGRHGHYLDEEASGLLQLYGDQINRALSWTIGDPFTLALLEEMEQTVNLFSAMAANVSSSGTNEAVKRVLQFFTADALMLLQQLNYALTHPNHLASLFEPITAEEKSEFEAESGKASVNSPAEVINPMQRPFLAKLVHRLFRLSGSILSTLTSISRAEVVLIGEHEDWPLSEAVVVPHSKVVLGEPTSMGTLLELGNCSLDVLRHLVDRPPTQALTPVSGTGKALDVRDSVKVTRRSLEGVLVYATTQLAMWLSKPEFDAKSSDIEIEETGADGLPGESLKRSVRRQSGMSMSMAERMRRGMTGELAHDLQALVEKAKLLIAKSDAVLEEKTVDLTQVLTYFVHERIAISP
ncbi:hypothetical protein WOLCODRAFT_99195 [Wolfiporia cocos MD-104 SS10]|uniref:Nucleoporin NUP188 n=1 Tax=Wolfiporia cocos (strain MD-104) TaxID=742152 RepID=A0A2H3JET7_WOLCO|nr:hypothetical protein WOLCODRAFT_99195 [Wolfiporia cocos MD-104 SS10]